VFEKLREAYDRIVGLLLQDIAVDGAMSFWPPGRGSASPLAG
jgi:hypothetical protein